MAVKIRRHGQVGASGPLAAACVMITSLAFCCEARAQVAEVQYRRAPAHVIELPPPEARGCYYYRGRRHCGAYCYWEVNGKRYCQRRERDAHSQAPVVEDDTYGLVLK